MKTSFILNFSNLVVLAELTAELLLVLEGRVGAALRVGTQGRDGELVVLVVVGHYVELVQTLGALHNLPLSQQPTLRTLSYRSCQ